MADVAGSDSTRVTETPEQQKRRQKWFGIWFGTTIGVTGLIAHHWPFGHGLVLTLILLHVSYMLFQYVVGRYSDMPNPDDQWPWLLQPINRMLDAAFNFGRRRRERLTQL